MTRNIWMLCLMAVFALGASAQSIVGKWVTEPETDDDGKIIYVFNFKDSKNFELGAECDMSDEGIILDLEVFVKGTYSRDGNQISFAFDKNELQFNIKRMDFTGEEAELIKENPELKNEMIKLIKNAVEEQKETIMEDLPTKDNALTILELTDTTLKMAEKDDDDVLIFSRVK